MTQTVRRFFSADNLERAVLEAAGHYGIEPERLRYQPVEKKHGFTKRRRVVIRVDPDNVELARDEPPAGVELAAADRPAENEVPAGEPDEIEPSVVATDDEEVAAEEAPLRAEEGSAEGMSSEEVSTAATAATAEVSTEAREEPEGRRAEAPAADEPAPEDGAVALLAETSVGSLPESHRQLIDLLAEPTPEVAAAASAWLTRLLDLSDLDLEATLRTDAEGLVVWLDGPDAEWLGDDDGEALSAFQALLPRLMQGNLGKVISVRVDCNGALEYREERLRDVAHRAAAEVRRSGARSALDPMMPADRRIVHLALANDATVETESVGRGFFKRVTVRPA